MGNEIPSRVARYLSFVKKSRTAACFYDFDFLRKHQVAYKPGSVHKASDLHPALLDDYSSGTSVTSRL